MKTLLARSVYAALLWGLIPLGARAEEPRPRANWGFSGNLRTGGASGDYGNLFREPISGELDFFRLHGDWRFGIGVSYGSFGMQQPYEDAQEWGFLQSYVFATRMLRSDGVVRPYIQLRGGFARLHPRSFLFAETPLPDDLEPGDSPTQPANGWSVGAIPGVELWLGRAFSLDASVAFTWYSTEEYDLSPVNQPNYSSGSKWQARLGATWVPHGGQPESDAARDAWGVRKSFGWAAGEMLAINYGAGLINEYIRDANFNQTSPRSWWANLEEGFTYDDNKFKTNQWAHPFNGAAYFNSGRSNGLGFWESSGFAITGAFYWECCGETHPMSINDLIATGLGGMATGEARYRLSSEILDNQDTGKSRLFREFGAFLVNPIRGFNRLLSGRAKDVAANPADPMDWRPKGGTTFLAAGTESFEDDTASDTTETYPMLLLNHSYGDEFENTRRKPYDYMDFVAELDLGQKTSIDNVQIRGNLASWPLGDETSPNHVLALVQYFDYLNNDTYEFGGQSLGAALKSRFRLSKKTSLTTRVDAIGLVLGGVNSDYSWLADVADQERVREYDYGPGLGAMATAELTVSGHPLLRAIYRFQWISVTNGSTHQGTKLGADANHYLQSAGLRLVVPIKRGVGIGADALVFFRDSHYDFTDETTGVTRLQDIHQNNPQLRFYLALSNVR